MNSNPKVDFSENYLNHPRAFAGPPLVLRALPDKYFFDGMVDPSLFNQEPMGEWERIFPDMGAAEREHFPDIMPYVTYPKIGEA